MPYFRALLTVSLLSLCLVHGGTRIATATPAAVWAACGTSSPVDKVVRVWPRTTFVPGPAGTTSTLLCGNEGFGFRHISARHEQDWQNIAFYTGENWRDLTDFAIEQILRVPQSGYPRYNDKNDTWAFKAPLEIRDGDGNVRMVYHPLVIVAGGDGRIITAYPTRDPT